MTRTPLNVLIVEDVPLDAEVMVSALRRAGYEPHWHRVANEQDFVDSLDPSLDVILADYHLPGFDALRALTLLREADLGVPLIVVTGALGDESAAGSIRLGAADYLLKDRIARLGPAVRKALDSRKMQREREQIESARRYAERQARFILEHLPVALFRLRPDRDNACTFISDNVRAVTGFPPRRFMEDPYFFVERIHDDDLPRLTEALGGLEPGGVAETDFRWQVADGSYRWLRTSLARVEVEPEHVLGLFEDVTARRNAEESAARTFEQLRETNERLQRAIAELRETQEELLRQERLHALGEMASGIAHDINNALSPVVGYADLILTQPEVMEDRERLAGLIGRIREAGQDAAETVRQLRQFYRAPANDEPREWMDVAAVVLGAIEMTRPRWKTEGEAMNAVVRIDSDLSDLPPIMADVSEIRQAIVNLILNACDAMPHGGVISITGRVDRDELLLEVRDSGMGMAPDTVTRCFEPFYTTKGAKGTGMGLAMVYGTIQRHGGSITVTSELGIGTSFTLRFPLTACEPQPATKPPVDAHDFEGLNVLVAEDEAPVARMLADFLSHCNHNYTVVANGREAIERLSAEPFDLLISDLAMPDMNGDELARLVKGMRPDIPIIMLTGMAGELYENPDNVDAVAAKPIGLPHLKELIQRVVRREAAMPPEAGLGPCRAIRRMDT